MITVVGSINLDLIATVDRLPKPGETVPGDAFTTSPGGKGANQALAARNQAVFGQRVGNTPTAIVHAFELMVADANETFAADHPPDCFYVPDQRHEASRFRSCCYPTRLFGHLRV